MIQPYMQELIIEPLYEDVIIPTYASEGDSGMDVYSREDMILRPGEKYLFKLGFKMQIPKHALHGMGYRWEAQARPRSGVSLKTEIRVSNSPGTIDNFYEAEVGIILQNTLNPTYKIDLEIGEDSAYAEIETVDSSILLGLDGKPVIPSDNPHLVDFFRYPMGTTFIRKGDRIAQLVFNEVVRPMNIIIGKVGTSEDRGGGFGSSGR